MNVLEAIKGRRSIRAFKSQNVSAKIIKKLVDAALWAPSAGNIQPWEFIIVRKPEIKRRLAEAALGNTLIEEASVVIVVCANENRSSQGYGIRGKTLYCIQDTAAAIQNIHQGIRPVAIIPVGYPAEAPSPPSRRPISQIVHYETF